MLPHDATVVGLDEHTGLILDLARAEARVLGQGRITVVREGEEQHYGDDAAFGLDRLGPFRPADSLSTLPTAVVDEAAAAAAADAAAAAGAGPVPAPKEVLDLVAVREAARRRQDWAAADVLRGQIEALGWQVQDTPSGPNVAPGGVAR